MFNGPTRQGDRIWCGRVGAVEGLAAPWVESGVTRVVGVEARGFLLGGAVAIRLGVGFQPVRKPGSVFPGRKRSTTSEPDYRGTSHVLSIQDTLSNSDVVLMVDDWAERGSQALAVRELVQGSGATYIGLSVIVDQLTSGVRELPAPVTSLVIADDLGPAE